jgi:tRNA uridine 5-carbamoylmethylation protein Kti12
MTSPFSRPQHLTRWEQTLMAILDSLSTSVTALIASNDAVLAKLASSEAALTKAQADLTALQGQTIDPAQLQAIIDQIAAETAKNTAA